MRRKLTFLTLLASAWAGFASAQVPIREIRLTLEPTTYSGPCPARLRAHVVFVSNYPTRVDEDNWGWNFGRLAPHSWDVLGGHLRTSGRETTIDTTLTLPWAGDTGGGLLHEGSVFVIMELAPTISNKVTYSVRCSPAVSIDPNVVRPIQPRPTVAVQKAPTIPPPSGGGPGPAVHLPDLVPEILDPFAFRFSVKNVGDAAAGPSAVLLKCRATSGGVPKGACPSDPSFAPLFDASLGGYVVPVPAIPAGSMQPVPLPPHGALTWPPGTYEFTATADVRRAVPERNEGNNTATRTVTR